MAGSAFPQIVMHALIESAMGDKPALQPNAAIGPAVRAIAADILAQARLAITDPERWRHDARDHARSLSHSRDGAAALNAFDSLVDKSTLVLSTRSIETIRSR